MNCVSKGIFYFSWREKYPFCDPQVSGNFHVTAGKSVPLMRGHAHLSAFMGESDYNFTHRVDKFSFGPDPGGVFGVGALVQPLEGEEKIAEKSE